MFPSPTRAIVLAAAVCVAGAICIVWVVSSLWRDPGDKGHISTTLVTPTSAAEHARVFAVSSDDSQVDFVVRVYGLALNGVFPITDGTITLEPVGAELRVLVQLTIHVDAVETGNDPVNALMRGVMATGDYPLAFYVASSRGFVPVTTDEITFEITGDLEVHNVVAAQSMAVTAQLVGAEMWAVAVSDLDLSRHGVEMPSLAGSPTIELTARLQAFEIE